MVREPAEAWSLEIPGMVRRIYSLSLNSDVPTRWTDIIPYHKQIAGILGRLLCNIIQEVGHWNDRGSCDW